MYRIPLPVPETTLLLSSRFVDLSHPLYIGIAILVCLVPLGLAVWLYHAELRLVHRGVALGLLLCRLLVLALLLFIVGFQPIIARSATEHLPGRVLIAVDRSQSMDIADPQRAAVDKLRLARALKLAGGLCSDSQLEDWIRQYEEKGSPQWLAAADSSKDQEQRQKLSAERRRLHDQVCQRVDHCTRTEIARRVLSKEGLGLLPALAARHQVELLGFAREAWPAEPEQLERLFQPADSALPVSGKAEARPPAAQPHPSAEKVHTSATDLRLPLIRSLEAAGADQGRVLGVVLLTDGQHNAGPSPVAQAQRLGAQGLPIYPIALGAQSAPPDIAMVGVKAPSAVFKGADAPVEARLKVSGLPAQDIAVELQCPDQAPLEERFHHDGSDRYYTVSFQVRLEKSGPQSLLLSAQPVPGEMRTDNNSRPLVIHVADDTARVLLIDGEARWEYHYLANALLRDRTVQVQRVLFAQPRLGSLPEDELLKTGNPLLTLPNQPDALALYDCIILGDVSPAQWSREDRQRLERYVADRGGTLVIGAGKRFMPLSYTNGPNSAEDSEDPFRQLLPIEEPRVVQSRKGFAVTLTHEGKLSPFLQLEPTSEKNARRWSELPHHYWAVVGRSKPGATPLAYLRDEVAAKAAVSLGREAQSSSARTEAIAQEALEKEQALIVRQNYGFGRVLFIGLESTWRWRYKVGDPYHHRFWGQVVRWAASDKPLVAGNKYVRFGTRDAVYRQGQAVELLVRLGDDASRLPPDTLAGARIFRLAGSGPEATSAAIALVPLKRRPRQPRVLEGRIRDLPAGQYAIELAIPDWSAKLRAPPDAHGQSAMLRAPFTVLPPEGEEMVELATNFPLLEQLAAKSGGKLFAPEDALDLVAILARHEGTRAHYSEHRLWQWWATLALVLGLLTTEWVGRKWAGLP